MFVVRTHVTGNYTKLFTSNLSFIVSELYRIFHVSFFQYLSHSEKSIKTSKGFAWKLSFCLLWVYGGIFLGGKCKNVFQLGKWDFKNSIHLRYRPQIFVFFICFSNGIRKPYNGAPPVALVASKGRLRRVIRSRHRCQWAAPDAQAHPLRRLTVPIAGLIGGHCCGGKCQ